MNAVFRLIWGLWETGKACTVCTHKDRPVVELALIHRVPLRVLTRRFGLSAAAISNHKKAHMPPQLKAAVLLAAKPSEIDRWPDFRLRWNNRVLQYEITTADKEGRCAGKEHKSDQPPAFDDWKADLAQVPSAIKRAAQLKGMKQYSESVGLVIYSLIGDYDWSGTYGRDEVERAMHDVTSPAKDKFEEIWVRWGGRLYLLWDHAKRTELVLS